MEATAIADQAERRPRAIAIVTVRAFVLVILKISFPLIRIRESCSPPLAK
jgi:hypothetical protein